MTTRRNFFTVAAILGSSLTALNAALAQTPEAPKEADFLFVQSSKLKFPANRQTPVDVEIVFKTSEPNQPPISAGFNWLEESGEIWTVTLETLRGDVLKLEKGGTALKINGHTTIENPSEEYEQIYEHFARLLKKGKSDVSDAPLRIVADAFLLGARENVEPFDW